jgi:hypothetical protein
MIQIENKIISKDVFEKQFICDLNACKGACCVEGDSGAPLLEDEIKKIEEIYDDVKEYMTRKGRGIIEEKGVYVIDSDGDVTTPLINDRQCAFVISENGISKCAIEKAYTENKTDFKKPISCHLFPIRITSYKDFDAINYESIKICSPACDLGKSMQVAVYEFLEESIVRRYGQAFYNELRSIAKAL